MENTSPSTQLTTTKAASFLSMRNIIIAILVLVALYVGSTYNTLITKNEMVTTQWSQVESQYQRRLDLIPNLVGSVQGIMNQEQEVFKAIADARSRYAGSTTPDEKAASATQVESALARLLVVMENYPQLRSVETVQTLMAELAGTENRVAVERMRYNEVVRDFNIKVKTYPSGWVAALFGIPARELFEAAEGADVAPTVNFE